MSTSCILIQCNSILSRSAPNGYVIIVILMSLPKNELLVVVKQKENAVPSDIFFMIFKKDFVYKFLYIYKRYGIHKYTRIWLFCERSCCAASPELTKETPNSLISDKRTADLHAFTRSLKVKRCVEYE